VRFLYSVGGDGQWGYLTAPNHFSVITGIKNGAWWGADLGCVDGPKFVKKIEYIRAREWLIIMEPYKKKCLFVAGGDVVGDARRTLAKFEQFTNHFRGWPLAYVAQDGAESLPIPKQAAALFLGGSTKWKLSSGAIEVIKRAQTNGLHIHIGRVNWRTRYNAFRILSGSDKFTCDGTRQRFEGIEKTEAAWRGYESQLPLIQI
jgi:hypothetical protein